MVKVIIQTLMMNDDTSATALSAEWRATVHLFGINGKDKQTKKTYLDASFFGQYNKDHKNSASGVAGEYDDLIFYGLHTVYNQPEFLLSAQYVKSDDTSENSSYVSAQAGKGYSFNGEYRFGSDFEYRILGRYDTWKDKELSGVIEPDNKTYILGTAWEQNKNIQWVANTIITDNDDGSARETENGIQYMLTAEIRY